MEIGLLLQIALICFVSTLTADACESHKDCIGLTLCEDGRCVAAVPSKAYCTRQSECSGKQVCRFGICLQAAVSHHSVCRKHDECSGQRLCHRGRCMIAYPTDDLCTKDGSCSSGAVCKFKRCWKPLDEVAMKKLRVTEFIHLQNLIIKQKLHDQKAAITK